MSSQYAFDNPYWPYKPNASVVDLLPRDMLPMIHDHWYKFAPINPLWHSIIGLAMVLFGIISVTASDGLMMLFNATIMAVNSFYQTWVFGPFMCELYGISGSLMGNVSILTLMCISRDRYNVIVKGVSGRPLTAHRALGQIAIIWVYAFIWTVAPLFGWSRYVPEGNMTSCTIDFLTKDWKSASYVLVYGSFVYFVPLSVIVHSYYHIVKTVAVHEKQLRVQARKMKVSSLRTNQQQKKTRAEFRLAKIALITVSLWFTAWTPYLIIAWYGILGSGEKLTPLTAIWGSVFAKTSACYNPLVYAISHPRYRAALVKKFPSLACSGLEEADDKSETQSAVTAISAGTSKITPIDAATESAGPVGKVAKLLGSGDGNVSEDVEANDEATF